jgi:putative toxin-antitoxin system antitoxin component (TIGR02293 family)
MENKGKEYTRYYSDFNNALGTSYVSDYVESPLSYYKLAEKGIEASAVNNFREYFDVSQEDTAVMMHVSSPTLYRWIKTNKTLEKYYSVLILELTNLFLYGVSVFESKENFKKWLFLPNSALGNMFPQELLEFPGGISKVRDLLGRIEYGIYS